MFELLTHSKHQGFTGKTYQPCWKSDFRPFFCVLSEINRVTSVESTTSIPKLSQPILENLKCLSPLHLMSHSQLSGAFLLWMATFPFSQSTKQAAKSQCTAGSPHFGLPHPTCFAGCTIFPWKAWKATASWLRPRCIAGRPRGKRGRDGRDCHCRKRATWPRDAKCVLPTSRDMSNVFFFVLHWKMLWVTMNIHIMTKITTNSWSKGDKVRDQLAIWLGTTMQPHFKCVTWVTPFGSFSQARLVAFTSFTSKFFRRQHLFDVMSTIPSWNLKTDRAVRRIRGFFYSTLTA